MTRAALTRLALRDARKAARQEHWNARRVPVLDRDFDQFAMGV